MASIILRSNNVRAVHALGLLYLVLLVQKGAAFTFIVGDQKGWSVPCDPNSNRYNQWAEKSRFHIGDSLVFKYPAGQDSVLRVKSEDYANCNTDAPIAKCSDGYTVFSLNKCGPHYFISGNKDNCNKNEKLVVIVLADRSNRTSNQTASSPPSPSPQMAPSPAPIAQETPSPSPPPSSCPPAPIAQETPSPSPPPSSCPPTGQETPSSPPSSPPTEQATPSPPASAPATAPPPPNAASSVLVGFAGVGAFIVSSLVLSF